MTARFFLLMTAALAAALLIHMVPAHAEWPATPMTQDEFSVLATKGRADMLAAPITQPVRPTHVSEGGYSDQRIAEIAAPLMGTVVRCLVDHRDDANVLETCHVEGENIIGAIYIMNQNRLSFWRPWAEAHCERKVFGLRCEDRGYWWGN
jgi:hypothetical protein